MSPWLMLARGVLYGLTAVVLTHLATVGLVGASQTLSPAVIVCLMLPCKGPCSLHRPGIVPSCISAAFESRWQL